MRIMQDVIGSQKLIPCTLIILTFVLIRLVPDIAYMTVQTVYSTAYRCLYQGRSHHNLSGQVEITGLSLWCL